MPGYLLYRDDLETPEPDEPETHQKIIDVMTTGMHNVRENMGRSVRISHAKAYGLLKGTLVVESDLPAHLAQGLFAKPATYPVLVRLATAPGEFNDNSKLHTVRGMAIKVLKVDGPKLAGHTGNPQDFVLDTGKEFINSGPKAFLQTFMPNAYLAPRLPDTVKGLVSDAARATNAALNAVGINSEKLDFFGHPNRHPMAEAYFSQTPYRYGDHVVKIGVLPDTPGLKQLFDQPYDPEGYDAFRKATNQFFETQGAEFAVAVQLNTGLDEMPIEDAQAKWPEQSSHYQTVARLILPPQTAWDPERDEAFEEMSFSPAHALAAHRPLGGINRARLVVYSVMADRRRLQNNHTIAELGTAAV